MPDRKVSRREQRRQELARARQRRWLVIGAPVLVVAVALAALAYHRFRPVPGVVEAGPQERGHDVEASFPPATLPPVGGVHHPQWQNCGVYTEPVDAANAVHSLEHGAIWITYRPELPAAQVQALQNLAWDDDYLLLSPYPGQAANLVLSAWGVRLALEDAADSRITDFIDRYRGLGPEPGASCSGGVGTPIN